MYINKEDQNVLVQLIQKYLNLINEERQKDLLMNKIYFYVDKIIIGLIFSYKYNFHYYADYDDLLQEGRMAVFSSIIKKQWKAEKGSIFNFFSTVISNNLKNYTSKHGKHKRFKAANLDDLEDYNLKYYHDFEKDFIVEDSFLELRFFFKEKQKFEILTDLLHKYYMLNKGGKFIKKNFISYAKANGFSPATVNNFFNLIKRSKYTKNIQNLFLDGDTNCYE